MTASIALLALVVLAAVLAVRGHRNGGRRFGLHQFRPAAPLVGLLPVDRDRDRLVAELQALPDAPAGIRLRLR